MKFHRLHYVFINIFFYILCITSVFSQTAYFKSAQTVLGNVDSNGYVVLSRLIYTIDMGNGYRADVFILFSSDPSNKTTLMGKFWTLPFFTSRIEQISNFRCIWHSPNNGKYIFLKDLKNSTKAYNIYYQKGKGKLKLKIYQDGYAEITSTKDPKYNFCYKKHRLVNLCYGTGFKQIKIEYTSQGQPSRVINLTDQKEELNFLYKNGFLRQIQINGRKVGPEFKYVENSLDIKNKDLLLSSIRYLSGVEENFQYERIPNKVRYIYIDNTSLPINDCVINRLTYGNDGNNWVEWDEYTGFATQDSYGKYAIYNPYIDDKNPDYDMPLYSKHRTIRRDAPHTAISYKQETRKYADIWERDSSKASRLYQDGETGKQRKVYYITAPGTAYMKVRKIEQRENNTHPWKLTEQRIYSPNGNLIRKITLNCIYDYKYKLLDANLTAKETYLNSVLTDNKIFSNDGNLIEHTKYKNGNTETTKFLQKGDFKVQEVFFNNKLQERKTFKDGWKSSNLIMKEESNGDIIKYSYKDGIREELIEKKDGTRILKKYDSLKQEFTDIIDKTVIDKWISNLFNNQ